MADKTAVAERDVCGIVMPISAIDDCSESHWAEVLAILSDAISEAGLRPNLVSNADDVGIIQKRIIQNLYENPIVVCDVSGKNPNVMFELGLRLAFDKPTIIIKDDKTDYSFDTAPIEHLDYPRDLRFSQVIAFRKRLSEKLKATLNKSRSDHTYTTFLKHFGEFTVVEIGKKEVSQVEFISEELSEIRRYLRKLDNNRNITATDYYSKEDVDSFCLNDSDKAAAEDLVKLVCGRAGIRSAKIESAGDHHHLVPIYSGKSDSSVSRTRASLKEFMMKKGFFPLPL